MKKTTIGIVILLTVAFGLVGLNFAQRKINGKHQAGFAGQGFPPQFLVEKISKELGLSEEQKTQAEQILNDSKTRVQPLIEQIKQNHKLSKELGTDGNFDEQKVNQIADQQSETMKQLFVEREKTKAELFALLTPEQREKAKQMLESFAGKMKGRFGHRFHKAGEKAVPSEK